MPLLVDGNNLAHRLAGGADRAAVRRRVLDFVRHQKVSVIVIFDGPPPEGSPDREVLGQVTVIYGGRRSADDLIVQRIPHGGAARSFTVITDDRGLARRVRDAGGRVMPASEWMNRLPSSGHEAEKPTVEAPLPASTVAEWEKYFSRGSSDDDPTS